MDLNEYQKLAMRTDNPAAYTLDGLETPEEKMNGMIIARLGNGVMGLNGEAGEAIDVFKKAIYQGHELKIDEFTEELGDVLWYLALCADALGLKLNDIAEANIEKLKKRYPDGFTTRDSIERKDHDKDGESDVSALRDES